MTTICKKERVPNSEDNVNSSSSNNEQSIPTEELDIASHLNEGNIQYEMFTGSSLLNLDGERIAGLVNEEVLKEIKEATNLASFELSEAAAKLLSKIEESVPSSSKLRSIIRKSIGENSDFDLMEMYDINFIETLANHYLNLMDSPLNPLLGMQLERTAAVNTTIITLNNLFIDVNDMISFKWYEFFGGINFSNNDTKEKHDVDKLDSACNKSVEYITATTDLIVPVPEYVIRFYDSEIYFESVIKLDENVYVRRTYTVVPVPVRPALLKEFLAKTEDMYRWRNAVITLIKTVDEKKKHYH